MKPWTRLPIPLFATAVIVLSAVDTVKAEILNATEVARQVDRLMIQARQVRKNPAKPTNILLVIADDMGIDESRCYDNGRPDSTLAPMPNLSHLCRNGIVFENVWSAPICSPTRASIMTGRFGFRTGVGDAVTPFGSTRLDTNEYSIARALKMHQPDYAAAIVGKWHLSQNPDDPARLGWDHYSGLFGGGTQSYYEWRKMEHGQINFSTTYTTTAFVDDAIVWLQRRGDKPWFLWLAFNAPHAPFEPPPRHLHSQADLPLDGGRQHRQRYYHAMIEAMDTEFGRLLLSLGPKTLANTNIIFIGDNGTPGQVARAPVQRRRAKGSLYQGGLHVPMFIAGPAVIHGGRRVASLVNATDLFTTILEMAGADLTTTLPTDLKHDSVSLLPALRSRSQAGGRKFAYAERFGTRTQSFRTRGARKGKRGRRGKGGRKGGPDRNGHAIRDQRYKLVRLEAGQTMFYDLATDPHEEQNLIAGPLSSDQRHALERLKSELRLLRGP